MLQTDCVGERTVRVDVWTYAKYESRHAPTARGHNGQRGYLGPKKPAIQIDRDRRTRQNPNVNPSLWYMQAIRWEANRDRVTMI